ncbi:UDP-2-acetamido-2-deoxy-3-oxo-D-glucuronate aminotransferase [compost metagenome]
MVHYPIPLNKQPAVENLKSILPIGDEVAKTVLSLPMHAYLPKEVINEITVAIKIFSGS